MTKFRIYFNKDKETAWLNEMAQKGYALKSFFAGFYTFEPCKPGEYVYQIDFGNQLYSVSNDYREFMTENNIEIVCLWGYWIFLRKRASEGKFVLYTDVDSSIEHYTKILKMFKAVCIIELICFFLEVLAALHGAAIGIPFMFIIGVFVIALMYAAISTKRTINELKERKGETIVKNMVNADNTTPDTVSPFLLSGMFLNVFAIALNNSNSISPTLSSILHILAIILMFVGIYQSRNVFTK